MTPKDKASFFSEPTIQKLLLLVLVYIITIATVLTTESYFNKAYILKYQWKIQNQEQRQKIEHLLKENILALNLAFNNYPVISHSQELSNTQKEISDLIARSITYLDVL
jgi:hypothetical protein